MERSSARIEKALTPTQRVTRVETFARFNGPSWENADVADIIDQVMDADPEISITADMERTAKAVGFMAPRGLHSATIALLLLHNRRPSLNDVAKLLVRAGLLADLPHWMQQ